MVRGGPTEWRRVLALESGDLAGGERVGRGPAEGTDSRPWMRFEAQSCVRIGRLVGFLQEAATPPSGPVAGGMNRLLRIPSPAMVVACAGAVRRTQRRGVRGGDDRISGHRRRLDPQPRLQGRHPARQRGQAERLRRRRDQGAARSTRPSSTPADRPVDALSWPTASPATAVISNTGATRARARHHLERPDRRRPVPGDLRSRRAQLHRTSATLGDESASGSGHRPDRGDLSSVATSTAYAS